MMIADLPVPPPLKACPDKPNCVSSLASADDQHRMESLPLKGSVPEAQERVKQIMSALPRVELSEVRVDYLHFVAKTKWFGFADDVEFYFDAQGARIHFRSAARSGYYDFGVNRQRMQEFTRLYNALE